MKFLRNIRVGKIRFLYFIFNLFQKKPQQEIKTAFVERYPKSEYPLWFKLKDDSWQVSFDEDRHRALTAFTNDGKWLWSRSITQFLLLPQNFKDAFEVQFKKEFIVCVFALEFKEAKIYEVVIKENQILKRLLFNNAGLLINYEPLKKGMWS